LRHYRRFWLMFGLDDGSTRITRQSRSSRLLFRAPFLMFMSQLDHFPQATQQGNGWMLAKTTATILSQ